MSLLTKRSQLGSLNAERCPLWSRSQERGCMAGLLGVLFTCFLAWPALAQTATVYWQCQAVDSTHPVAGYCPVNTTYPLPVTASGGSDVIANFPNPVAVGAGASNASTLRVQQANPAAVISFQAKIAVTSTAVQLPANALTVGLVCRSKSTNNVAGIFVGPSGINTTYDGTGTGDFEAPGDRFSFAVGNSNAIYFNGTAGDIISCSGN